jgi:general secretion pathway protein G
MDRIQSALREYEQWNKVLPSTEQGLRVLVIPQNFKAQNSLVGVAEMLDAWERPFLYRTPGKRPGVAYDLWSAGADGKNGTDDDVFAQNLEARLATQ